MAIHSHYIGSGFGHSYGAFPSIHTMEVTIRINTHIGSNRDIHFFQYFNCPFDFFYMLKIFSNHKIYAIGLKHFRLFTKFFLNFGFSQSAEIGRRLADTTSDESIALIGNFPGQLAGGFINISHAIIFGSFIAPVLELVFTGVKGKGLHHIGTCP